MVAGIISLGLTGLGAALIVVGVVVSLSDRKKKAKAEGLKTEGMSGEVLEGAAKLADALGKHPFGMQLIIIGVVLIVIGAGTGGVAALGA